VEGDDNLVKKGSHPLISRTPQSTLDAFSKEDLLRTLTSTQITVIQHLQSGYYAAMISRKLNISRAYLSRFINELLKAELISPAYKDPLFRRATVYTVSKELANYISSLERKDEESLTLCTPHNVRYKRKIVLRGGKKIPIATDLSRFAHAKWEHIRTYKPKGGERYVFEMKGVHGRYRAIVHPTASIEMMCCDRNYIPAKGIPEATNILSMSLNDAYTKFIDEQRWCGVNLELGEPELVGSIHYAFKSKILKDEFVKKGQTKVKITETAEIDNSPEDHADPIHAEFETPVRDEAIRFDESLRMVPKVHDELKSIQETILGISGAVDKIDMTYNSVQALCQSGIPVSMQLDQMQTIVARQGQTIAMMQETMLGIVQNMAKILDKMNIE